jgi:hypothetical protein
MGGKLGFFPKKLISHVCVDAPHDLCRIPPIIESLNLLDFTLLRPRNDFPMYNIGENIKGFLSDRIWIATLVQ